jgi:hypothetical protein
MVHGTREAQLDDLLRGRKLVDLFKVVREAVRISEPGYSLKNVEVFFGSDRAGGVKTALDSMVVYDHWQQTGDQALLDQIGAYNEADCRSLLGCRDWLLSLRPSEVSWFGTVGHADATDADAAKDAKRKDTEERNDSLVKALLDGVPQADRKWRELAGQLIDFHRREAKPDWWAMFNRQDMTEEELIDDAECIGGLEPDPDRPQFAVNLHLDPLFSCSGSLSPAIRVSELSCSLAIREDMQCRMLRRRPAERQQHAAMAIPGGP